MELDEFHVRDLRARAPGHGHAVAGRDGRIGRVEIDFAATAGREDHLIRAKGADLPGGFIEHVSAQDAVLGGKAELVERDEIDRRVILKNGDARISRHRFK